MRAGWTIVLGCTAFLTGQGLASTICPEQQTTKQLPPVDPKLCDALDQVVRKPSAQHGAFHRHQDSVAPFGT